MDRKPSQTAPSTTARGLAAEERAAIHLSKHCGYQTIAKNFRWKGGEADIIMQAPDGAVVLIEVRSIKIASRYLRFSIDHRKQRRLENTMMTFLLHHPQFRNQPHRIEIVWVEGERIEHWPRPF